MRDDESLLNLADKLNHLHPVPIDNKKMSKAEAQALRARWAIVNAAERDELRNTSLVWREVLSDIFEMILARIIHKPQRHKVFSSL